MEPFVCIQLGRYLLSCPEMDATPREERKKRREQEDEEAKHTVMRIDSLFGACWRRLTEFWTQKTQEAGKDPENVPHH